MISKDFPIHIAFSGLREPGDETRFVNPIFVLMCECCTPEPTFKQAKLLILATLNQVNWSRWMQKACFTVDAGKFLKGTAFSTLMMCKHEGQMLHDRNARERLVLSQGRGLYISNYNNQTLKIKKKKLRT